MATSALKDTHRAVTELTESGMEPFPAGAVVRLVKESITEGCASRADLDRTSAALRADLAEFAADINATIAAHKAETDMHFALWEERSKSFVTRDDLAEALRQERKHADARFARVWGDEGFGATRSDARDLRSEFRGLRSDFGKLRGEFRELQGQVTELRGEVIQLKGQFEELRGEVTDLKGQVADLRDEVRDVRDEIKDVRGELRAQRTYMDEQFARIWGDEGLGGVRAEIKELSGRITELHEKMFGTAATWFKVMAGLVGLILVVLQIYQVFGN